MHTLVFSISCSVAVSVLLKVARARQIQVIQAIAVNYVIASVLCLLLFRPAPASLLTPATPWWILIALGLMLPTIFLAMAAAVRHAGIVLSDAAQRLSLFIPLIASFLVFGEVLSFNKAAGIMLALVALVLLLVQRGGTSASTQSDTGSQSSKAVFYLLCVWVGYGLIDIMFKQLARSGAAFSSSLLVTFVLAGIIIFSWLFARRTQSQGGCHSGTAEFRQYLLLYQRTSTISREPNTCIFSDEHWRNFCRHPCWRRLFQRTPERVQHRGDCPGYHCNCLADTTIAPVCRDLILFRTRALPIIGLDGLCTVLVCRAVA